MEDINTSKAILVGVCTGKDEIFHYEMKEYDQEKFKNETKPRIYHNKQYFREYKNSQYEKSNDIFS